MPTSIDTCSHQGQEQGGSGSGNARRQDTRTNQNKNLKEAWEAKGITSFYSSSLPFHDTQAHDNKMIVMSITDPNKHICLPMALVGRCYSACKGKHGVLSMSEVEAVAEARGLDIEA